MEKSSYFYVLHCKDNSFYGGYTTDLDRRLSEHNEGIGAKYTRAQSRRPLRMIYAEKYETRSEATKAEAAFKKQTRLQKELYLKNGGVRFPLDESAKRIVINCTVNREEGKANEKPEKL